VDGWLGKFEGQFNLEHCDQRCFIFCLTFLALLITFGEPCSLSHLADAAMSATAPGQSSPCDKCCASATSSPTFPRYKLLHTPVQLLLQGPSQLGDFITKTYINILDNTLTIFLQLNTAHLYLNSRDAVVKVRFAPIRLQQKLCTIVGFKGHF
jgi:hypothetical protein